MSNWHSKRASRQESGKEGKPLGLMLLVATVSFYTKRGGRRIVRSSEV